MKLIYQRYSITQTKSIKAGQTRATASYNVTPINQDKEFFCVQMKLLA